ncbi:dienelactone hydrolase family protein [Sneathiella sp.]|jgi:carboxymethylenebutenolidase|uniref:dienelactone hydrolase family protein n=1 Tax=Sneathiella sp. TaxID=1964365 RepID=UPI0039E3D43D
MSEMVSLTADDNHQFQGYLASPTGSSKGGLVVVQEIFGVNSHIQSVCDRFARQGFTVLAPALFDRVSPNTELGYSPEDIQSGLAIRSKVNTEDALRDIQAAVTYLADESTVSVIGYCWGGTLSYLSACRLSGISKAVGYYGGGINEHIQEQPQIPTQLHFGDQDGSIPMKHVDAIMNAHPELDIHVYQAGHGFNCDLRKDYNAPAAKLALERSLAFITGT